MKQHRTALVFSAFALALLSRGGTSLAVEANARRAALESITTEEVTGHVNALADDTFEGREAGSRGNRAAGIYMIDRLKKLAFKGGGSGGSYYQSGNGSNNILALVEGRDETLKNQVILIGAHYDHVGYGSYRNSFGPVGRIHNGADDNASGVAALLEVADALSRLPERPKRSILFAFWDAEEKGLLGSKYWVEHPTVPLDRLRLAINVDMIGRMRNSRIEVFGIRTTPGLRRLVSRQNDTALLLDFNWDVRGDSDHYTFFSRNMPILMMHTGLHDDYHRPSDDAEKINGEGLKQVAQLMFGVLIELADTPDLSGFRRQSQIESRSAQRASEVTLRPPPGRLGIRWDEAAARDGRIVVAAVVRGSAADAAGLRPGDRLVKFAGREVNDEKQFRIGVLAARSPIPLTVERSGESAPVESILQLPGEPVRLGISWRTDSAEPGTVIVNRLTPGSPADLAGLRGGDRIYRICGREFSSGEEFRQLAATSPAPLVLEVETAGRVRNVEIPQWDDVGGTPAPPSDDAAPLSPESQPKP
ncbi:MAG: M20/M25/M40 family metallo-hydrolase [Pirellulales bacterium]